MFDAKKYVCSSLWHTLTDKRGNYIPLRSKRRPEIEGAPVTLADHEAALAEATSQLDAGIGDGCPENAPDISQIVADCYDAEDATYEIQSWANDVILDCKVWERVAQDFLDCKAEHDDAVMKADHDAAERTKAVKAFMSRRKSRAA